MSCGFGDNSRDKGPRAGASKAEAVIVNMVVDLAGASFETPNESTIVASAGVSLVNRESGSPDDVAWIRNTFHGKWHEEAAAGWNWFARGALGPVGFAAYGQHSIRFWWLDQWWDREDVGIIRALTRNVL